MIDFLINIKNFILNLCGGLIGVCRWMVRSGGNYAHSVQVIRNKLANLEAINFDLVDYYIKGGNFTDAILRLKIIAYFIASENRFVDYKLAWCYFIKSNFSQAVVHLSKCPSFDSYGLQDYLSSSDVKVIPEDILMEYKNMLAGLWRAKSGDKIFEVAVRSVKIFAKYQVRLSGDVQILDLGSSDGIVAKALDASLPKKYILTGVESSSVMCKILNDYKIYDHLNRGLILNFLRDNIKRYDVIFSFCSLSFVMDLSQPLRLVANSMVSGGFFVITLVTSSFTELDKRRIQFLYEKSCVVAVLQACGFSILETCDFSIAGQVYTIFVCKLI